MNSSQRKAANSKSRPKITQSEVDEISLCFVPIFADLGMHGAAHAGGHCRQFHQDLQLRFGSKPKKVALNAYKEILER